MKTKVCFRCNKRKPLSSFYTHSAMTDGHLNKCKVCTKADVTKRYQDNPEKIRDYERKRNQDPKRKAYALQKMREHRKFNPGRYRARNAVNNAIRSGKLIRQPCVHCGDPKSQAHHKDYRKPLDVVWVCFKCHREVEHNQRIAQV